MADNTKRRCPNCGAELPPHAIISAFHSLVASRQRPHAGPGRPPKPTPCPRCGAMAPSASAALAHCRGRAVARTSKKP